MTFEISGILVPVIIKKKNNKNIYMRIVNNSILVTCNGWVSKKEIVCILEKNRKELEKMWNHVQIEKEREQYFYYLGNPYNIMIKENQNKVEIEEKNVYCKDLKSLEKFYGEECKRIFNMEVLRIKEYFKDIPKFTLKIRKMKTRWGVNNLSGHSITLNSELLKKDLDLIDYVIIHELCHFYYQNHSPSFWTCVESYYPKYKEARKRLRG